MPEIEYRINVTESQDETLIKIAEEMGFDYDVGVLNLIKILIEAEIERYEPKRISN